MIFDDEFDILGSLSDVSRRFPWRPPHRRYIFINSSLITWQINNQTYTKPSIGQWSCTPTILLLYRIAFLNFQYAARSGYTCQTRNKSLTTLRTPSKFAHILFEGHKAVYLLFYFYHIYLWCWLVISKRK